MMPGNELRIRYMVSELPRLLRDRVLMKNILSAIAAGALYPDPRSATMFPGEVVLYRDPERLFSLRLYLWGPGEYNPVHDHNSWGVIGAAAGKLEVLEYRLEDSASTAEAKGPTEKARRVLLPGQVCTILPLNEGIHRTGNSTEETIAQVGIYGGSQTGRRHITVYDLESGTVGALYAPSERKKNLAGEALQWDEKSGDEH